MTFWGLTDPGGDGLSQDWIIPKESKQLSCGLPSYAGQHRLVPFSHIEPEFSLLHHPGARYWMTRDNANRPKLAGMIQMARPKLFALPCLSHGTPIPALTWATPSLLSSASRSPRRTRCVPPRGERRNKFSFQWHWLLHGITQVASINEHLMRTDETARPKPAFLRPPPPLQPPHA